MRLSEVIFVEMEDAERAHARVLADFGGSAGYIDRRRLESAVQAARNGYFSSLAEVAAAYLVGITLAHACVDGNKRLGVTCAGMFLRVNGFPVRLDLAEWESLVLRVAKGHHGDANLEDIRQDVIAAFVDVMGAPGSFEPEP